MAQGGCTVAVAWAQLPVAGPEAILQTIMPALADGATAESMDSFIGLLQRLA